MTSLGRDGPDGPLPILLISLTFVTAMVDAVELPRTRPRVRRELTGNVVFLGFALGSWSRG